LHACARTRIERALLLVVFFDCFGARRRCSRRIPLTFFRPLTSYALAVASLATFHHRVIGRSA
jgi:hypothetical protein